MPKVLLKAFFENRTTNQGIRNNFENFRKKIAFFFHDYCPVKKKYYLCSLKNEKVRSSRG